MSVKFDPMTLCSSVKFSCTLAFNASYFLKTAVNLGNATFIISANINPKNITAPKNTSDKLGLIKTDINIADISMIGALTSIQIGRASCRERVSSPV